MVRFLIILIIYLVVCEANFESSNSKNECKIDSKKETRGFMFLVFVPITALRLTAYSKYNHQNSSSQDFEIA